MTARPVFLLSARIFVMGMLVGTVLPRQGDAAESPKSQVDSKARTTKTTQARSVPQPVVVKPVAYRTSTGHQALALAHSPSKFNQSKTGKARVTQVTYSYGGISCVPFARAASGIELKGNAANWWDAADGVYERGSRPEPASVLNFRATGRMRLGHVAVVTRVIDSRQIEIDHANWWGPGAGKGGVARAIPVVDVSERNDWSQVRVGLGHTSDFGSVYPTYGFIYDRPDRGTMVANTMPTRPVPASMRANLRYGTNEEVADASTPRFAVIDAAAHSLR
jgi:surface antigen